MTEIHFIMLTQQLDDLSDCAAVVVAAFDHFHPLNVLTSADCQTLSACIWQQPRFLPHSIGTDVDAPLHLATDVQACPPERHLLHVAEIDPSDILAAQPLSVIEVITPDESHKAQQRARFKLYATLGHQPQFHQQWPNRVH